MAGQFEQTRQQDDDAAGEFAFPASPDAVDLVRQTFDDELEYLLARNRRPCPCVHRITPRRKVSGATEQFRDEREGRGALTG